MPKAHEKQAQIHGKKLLKTTQPGERPPGNFISKKKAFSSVRAPIWAASPNPTKERPADPGSGPVAISIAKGGQPEHRRGKKPRSTLRMQI